MNVKHRPENKMNIGKVMGMTIGALMILFSLLISFVLVVYLSEYGILRYLFSTLVVMVGIGSGSIAYFRISKLNMRRNLALTISVVLAVFLFAPVISMFYPGKITFCRFGLTVYGVIPIPTLDIQVNNRGLLWFRDKNHYVSLNEIKSIISPDVDSLVIGIGWDGDVRVDPSVKELKGVNVYTLITPDAFSLYNKLKSNGKRVVLIAHSTC